MLSGPAIVAKHFQGLIEINPFLPENIGPNSIDVRLGKQLIVMEDEEYDLAKETTCPREFTIPPEGFRLMPGVGYLGSIMERIKCHGYVPWIDGRSTIGRRFLQIHMTAGKGDDGWDGCFTIEMMAMYKPVRVYAGMKIGQVSFMPLEGSRQPYSGVYNGQAGPRLPKPLQIPDYPVE